MSTSSVVARAASSLRERLEARLAAEPGELPQKFPIAEYVRILDGAGARRGYRFVPAEARLWCRNIEQAANRGALELYHKAVLTHLIAGHEQRLTRLKVPASIVALIGRTLQRILDQLDLTEPGHYVHENDLFAKDLALCRCKLLPCGSELVDICSGVPRRILLGDGLAQLTRATRFFLLRAGGFRPWYESHWDRRLIREFTPQAYDQCYLRMAALLEFNPQVRGVMSSSWWFDPALEAISPNLVYLRRVPEKGGAVRFKVGSSDDATRDALRMSNERTKLHEAGRYRPTVYLLAWARDDMLEWARRYSP